ncbi:MULTISPECIES: hypothetical protein [Bradyrhizobium]|uniref:hypothetical protein n=1 Tax=Bradyrhizobium TaxID=374 RepID=UPI00210FD289|nr:MULTISPECIES: hypothetical protein [Bradyrhizobium]WLB50087.1 hypothetical protein QIH93_05910 [Bradyrhizobium ottawaense]WLB59144.1 hypothetical protein QIH94_36670 [Bradyrhizobium japonicum]WLB67775.1 hypothetical protein QIH96_09210 [Bradyrhizobium japonicum]WQN86436.1 hypothetical protein U7859_10810 [Bradyrhizobium ottawaense]
MISIDRAASIVTLSNGSAIAYHRLMLATGARPRKLSIPIAEGANAATLSSHAPERLLLTAMIRASIPWARRLRSYKQMRTDR